MRAEQFAQLLLSGHLSQCCRQGEQALGVPWQKKEVYVVQEEEQPSPSARLPSSHSSAPTRRPSPQTSRHWLLAASRLKPVRQLEQFTVSFPPIWTMAQAEQPSTTVQLG